MILQVQTAKKIAKYGNVKRAKVAAVAFTSNGNILTKAHNRRVHGRKGKWTEHAEECVINKLNRIKAWNRFDNIIILVIRVNTRGLVMAKPCIKCQAILKEYPVSIFYTNENGEIKKFNKEN